MDISKISFQNQDKQYKDLAGKLFRDCCIAATTGVSIWFLAPALSNDRIIRYASLLGVGISGVCLITWGKQLSEIEPILNALRIEKYEEKANEISDRALLIRQYQEEQYSPQPQPIEYYPQQPELTIATQVDNEAANFSEESQLNQYWDDKPGILAIATEKPSLFEGRTAWMAELVSSGVILLYGRQGSGKTSKKKWLIKYGLEQGWDVRVCNLHAAFGQYRPLKTYGGGENTREIEDGINEFLDIVGTRYKAIGSQPNYDPYKERRVILACDEMSFWANTIEPDVMERFWKTAIGDLRKANCGIIMAAHGNTLNNLGGKALAGRSKSVNELFTELHCYSRPNPNKPGDYMPESHADFNFLGVKRAVYCPDWFRHDADFSEFIPQSAPHTIPPSSVSSPDIYSLIDAVKNAA